MPLPSAVSAQMHVAVPLLEPHMRSKPQRESQAGDVHTPFRQTLPKAQALSQRPQRRGSLLMSAQPPSQSSMPGPGHDGGLGVADVEEVVDDVSVVDMAVDERLNDDTEVDEFVLLEGSDKVPLADVLELLAVDVMLLGDADEVIVSDTLELMGELGTEVLLEFPYQVLLINELEVLKTLDIELLEGFSDNVVVINDEVVGESLAVLDRLEVLLETADDVPELVGGMLKLVDETLELVARELEVLEASLGMLDVPPVVVMTGHEVLAVIKLVNVVVSVDIVVYKGYPTVFSHG
ncbi:hypothetical protein BDW02DRAFT_630463 [Decorospora gaudefroyi]|uniref:Uncharacterized protein n=1 Tax=Decorospora gaudefroyi TaxID=184978 RepID=A0A6A5K943_9PLEO|nr:hypothetical protein BDW02DRAFT_630463 [Decorospora gaudefroyi]